MRFKDGHHRMGIAQGLKLRNIPVEVRLVHAGWLQTYAEKTGLPPHRALMQWITRSSASGREIDARPGVDQDAAAAADASNQALLELRIAVARMETEIAALRVLTQELRTERDRWHAQAERLAERRRLFGWFRRAGREAAPLAIPDRTSSEPRAESASPPQPALRDGGRRGNRRGRRGGERDGGSP